MLEAHAIPVLIQLLGGYPKSADLLCILAKEQQCKEAFFEHSALSALVECMHRGTSGTGLLQSGLVLSHMPV